MERKKRRFAVHIVCSVLPLIIGLFIYLTSGSESYISRFFANAGLSLPTIPYPLLFRYYICDFLWGFALYSALGLVLDSDKPNIIRNILTSVAVSITLETLQLIPSFPGSFDVWDMVVEGIAIVIAALVTKTLVGRYEYEE